jgi:hypothetical protein
MRAWLGLAPSLPSLFRELRGGARLGDHGEKWPSLPRGSDGQVLEPIQEDWIQKHWVDRVRRLSMMRIMARRMKAATVLV